MRETNRPSLDRRAAILPLAAFAGILTVPQAAEDFCLGVLAALGIFCLPRLGATYVLSVFGLLGIALITNAGLYLFGDYSIDPIQAAAEVKMFTLFFVQALLYRRFLFKNGVYQSSRVLGFYYVFVPALFLSTLIGTLHGSPRDSLIFGFSINAAYAVVFLSAYLLESIPLALMLVAVGAIGLLGSTTAALLMVCVIALRYNKNWLLSLILFAVCLVGAYFYAVEFRDKDFLNTDITSFDRYQINAYVAQLVAANFEPINYVLGWGIGHELPAVASNVEHISGWFLPEFTGWHVFSYATHNDYMRLFLDYGLVGLLWIASFIYRLLPRRVSLFLAFAAITNTTLFSTSNILILALIMADYRAHRQRPQQ